MPPQLKTYISKCSSIFHDPKLFHDPEFSIYFRFIVLKYGYNSIIKGLVMILTKSIQPIKCYLWNYIALKIEMS